MTPSRRTLVGLSAGTALAGASGGAAEPVRPAPGSTIDIATFGARGDGVADDTAAVLAAIAGGGGGIRVPAGRFVLSRDVVFPTPVRFEYRGVLQVGPGVTVNFEAGLCAGVHQIFALASGARILVNPQFTTVGYPEWWGARTNDPNFDCQPAIQAAVTACTRTVLHGADYYIGATVKLRSHGGSLEGVAGNQNGHAGASRLLLTSGTADGVQVGFDAQPAEPKSWLEHARVSDLTIKRVARIENPRSGFANAPCGVRLQWAVTCTLERIEAIEHSHGFFITGTVHCYLRYCQALRYTDGSEKENDFFNGFFMDNSPSTGANSGNASLYIQNCSTFSAPSVKLTQSSGVRSHMGYTDTFITGFESGRVGFGLNMNGRTSAGEDYQTENLIIDTCVVDTPTEVGILISTGSAATAVQIHNCYVAPVGGAVGIEIRNSQGSVGVTGCQLIAGHGNSATGLKIDGSSGVSSMNNIYTDVRNPVVIRNASDCRIADTINNVQCKAAVAAVQSTALDGGCLAPLIRGAVQTQPIGVALQGADNVRIEVNCTGIRPSCLVGGRANKLVCNGSQVVVAGAFGGGNLASGILE